MGLSDQMKTLNYMNKILSGERRDLTHDAFYPQKKTFQFREHVPLPRSTPSQQGMEDEQVLHFFKELEASERLSAHSAMVIKNGCVVAEAGFAPYELDTWHITHSLSKTIVALAVGIAIDEGLFKETDLVGELLSKNIPFLVSQNMRAVTIHHLLSMTSNVSFKEFGAITSNNWLRDFLRADFSAKPGEAFDYNSMNTYVLGCIISELTGQTLTEYLKPRLFEPLGMNNYFWEKTAGGQEKAGWGMYILLEEISKIGVLILDKGTFTSGGVKTQIVSSSWIEKMTTNYLKNLPLHDGYGYQIWIDREERFYNMSGLFGQMVWIYPEKKIVVGLFSGNQSIHSSGGIKKLLVDTFIDETYPRNNLENTESLTEELSKLTYRGMPFKQAEVEKTTPTFFEKIKSMFVPDIPEVVEGNVPQELSSIIDQTYELADNKAGILPFTMQAMTNNYFDGIRHVTFKNIDDVLYLLWVEKKGHYQIPVGFDQPIYSEIAFGKESQRLATYGIISSDEDDNLVIKLTFFFLETSSIRHLKIFFLSNDEVIFKFDETPSFYEMMRSATRGVESNVVVKSIISDVDYLNFMTARLAIPEIKGTKRKSNMKV